LVHPRPVDGLTWPQFFRSPDDENQTITYLFTSEEATQKVVANDPPELRRYHTLSGIEALRWIWAAPKNIDNVAVDYYPDSPAWLSFPSYWVLSAVFPIFYDIPDLKRVPSTGLAQLGELAGARGLKPEVIRSLVFGWKQLLGLDAAETTVVCNGRRYLPVFSTADQFLAFTSSSSGVAGKPKSLAGKEPPFTSWLEATVDCAGVVLDPAGPSPLGLEHTDLLVLDLWSRRPGHGPTGADAIAAIARLYYEKKISAALAGRMVADYPRYWVGLGQTPEGGGSLLMVPGTDACALFTSQDRAQQYLDFHMNLPNARAQIEGMQPIPVLTRWHASALAVASDQFTQVCINPDPYGTEGLFLGRDALDAALARIDDRLKPRVPGFVAEV